jgi:hypothetical protein
MESKMAVARKTTATLGETTTVTISPPNFQRAVFKIKGTAPFMQLRFGQKAMNAMHEKHAAGSTASSRRKKEARDFDDDFEQAKHISEDGWVGIPCSAFRNAMISACRLVGYKMTIAKMAVFVESDGLDKVDGVPLVKLIEYSQPEKSEMAVRNATGVADLRMRPMWRDWGAVVRVNFDADQFTLQDVTNLVMRVGIQVGLGEGRPDSRMSTGLGFGTFEIENC